MRPPPDFACKTTTPVHSTDPHYPPHKKHKAEDPASLATTIEIAERKAKTVLNDKMLLKKLKDLGYVATIFPEWERDYLAMIIEQLYNEINKLFKSKVDRKKAYDIFYSPLGLELEKSKLEFEKNTEEETIFLKPKRLSNDDLNRIILWIYQYIQYLPSQMFFAYEDGYKADADQLTITENYLDFYDSIKKNKKQESLKYEFSLPSIPRNIKVLLHLKTLDLSDTNLTFLPPEIGALTNLTELLLYENRLKKLPEELLDLEKLEKLILRDNDLKKLPENTSKLTALIKLDLDNNLLATLPSSIAFLTNLNSLYIDNNQFEAFPSVIRPLTSLINFSISDNQLSTIPEWIRELTNLEELVLSINQFKNLPSSLISLKKLKYLDVSVNQLKKIPVELLSETRLLINENPFNTPLEKYSLNEIDLIFTHKKMQQNIKDKLLAEFEKTTKCPFDS